MDKYTQQQLIAEIRRLQRRVRDLEDEVSLLRAQNDYLQEIIVPEPEFDRSERDTIPAVPKPSSDNPTRPSSPKAIRLDELHAALEASDCARLERISVNEELKWDSDHNIDSGPTTEPD